MKKVYLVFILSMLAIFQSLYAADLLRTDTGFYYPGNQKHQDSIYFSFGDRNPSFGNSCHLANDYSLPEGSPVYAVGEGIVRQASLNIPFYGGDDGTPGGVLIIEHTTADGSVFYGLYGHVKNFRFSVGQQVLGGQQIAEVGSFTSSGSPLPHLHFGVNQQVPSFLAYTPTALCSNFLGFVDPEVFLTSNSAKLIASETCVARDDTVSTIVNTIVTTPSVLENDSDTDGDTLSVSAADTQSANGKEINNNSDGTFTYTPAIDYIGTDSFNYTLTDNSGCSDQARVNITINNENNDETSGENSGSGGGNVSVMGLFSLLVLYMGRYFRRRR